MFIMLIINNKILQTHIFLDRAQNILCFNVEVMACVKIVKWRTVKPLRVIYSRIEQQYLGSLFYGLREGIYD